jgi:hypothetical protein
MSNIKVVKDLPNDEYHASESFGSSQIKDFINRPPKFFQAKHILKTLPRVESDAMNVGSATHTLWMESDKFASEYAVEPVCDARTKAGKLIKANFAVEAVGKKVITPKQGSLITHMCRALDNDRNARMLLKNTNIENSIFWTDDETGLNLRIRPDMWRSNAYLADMKTTKDASKEEFARSIFNFGYHISAAMYLDGMKQLGEDITDFVFVCVESSAPYLTATYTLSEQALEIGRNEYKKALKGLAHCLENDEWKGYNGDEVAEISLPIWILNRELAI